MLRSKIRGALAPKCSQPEQDVADNGKGGRVERYGGMFEPDLHSMLYNKLLEKDNDDKYNINVGFSKLPTPPASTNQQQATQIVQQNRQEDPKMYVYDNYVILDSRYRDRNNTEDGVIAFSIKTNRGVGSSQGNQIPVNKPLDTIIEIELFSSFKIPNATYTLSFENQLNDYEVFKEVDMLFQELSTQSYTDVNNNKFHFICDMIKNVTDNGYTIKPRNQIGRAHV